MYEEARRFVENILRDPNNWSVDVVVEAYKAVQMERIATALEKFAGLHPKGE